MASDAERGRRPGLTTPSSRFDVSTLRVLRTPLTRGRLLGGRQLRKREAIDAERDGRKLSLAGADGEVKAPRFGKGEHVQRECLWDEEWSANLLSRGMANVQVTLDAKAGLVFVLVKQHN